MQSKNMQVAVKNVTEGKGKYIVARPFDTDLWYYGRYEDYLKAGEVAREIEGVVVEDVAGKEIDLLRIGLKTMREEFFEKSCASAIIIFDEVMKEIEEDIKRIKNEKEPEDK